jgi:hypothetical protein
MPDIEASSQPWLMADSLHDQAAGFLLLGSQTMQAGTF